MSIENIILNRVNLVDYVMQTEDLVQNGNEWRGICPIHGGSNPSSFVIYPDNRYYCYACGASGNVINFVADRDKITFREAMYQIAKEIGINLDENNDFKNEEKLITKVENVIQKTHDRVGNISEYLHNRGFTDETIEKFKLGENRGTLFIPCYDSNGTAIGYTMRRFNSKPKYINPETSAIYEKGKVLFNMHNAKKIKSDKLYLVEGNLDAISGDQMGLPTVAYCGAIPTEEQIALIRNTFREGKTIIFCPDNDDTGRRIVKRARNRFRRLPGFEIRVLQMPEGSKDMNDLLVAGIDPKGLETVDIDKFILISDIPTFDSREQQYNFALEYMRDVKNPLIKNDCIKWLANYWNEDLSDLKEIFKSNIKDITEEVQDIQTVTNSIEDLQDLYSHGVFKTGFDTIDKCIEGINKKSVLLIGAGASVGKSDFACEFILRQIFLNKLRCLFFSMEMTRGKVMERIIAKIAKCPLNKVKDLIKEDNSPIPDIISKLGNYLMICDTNELSIDDIENKIIAANKASIMGGNVDVVIVDYLTKIKGTLDINVFAEVCQKLKGISKKHNIIFVMLAQLNRTGTTSDEITMNQLRGSGDVEQGADNIFLMWRPEKNIKLSLEEQEALHNITRLKVEKARDGMYGPNKCEFYYNPETTRWEER